LREPKINQKAQTLEEEVKASMDTAEQNATTDHLYDSDSSSRNQFNWDVFKYQVDASGQTERTERKRDSHNSPNSDIAEFDSQPD
jgi:hypothetical protein